MGLVRYQRINGLRDSRGSLFPIEANRDIPFAIKRVYFMRDLLPDAPRGFHAHRQLQQVAFCLSGSCSIVLDNGRDTESVEISDPGVGLLIDKLVWHEMHSFSKDCVLMLIASDFYDESDYIRDYENFKSICGKAQTTK